MKADLSGINENFAQLMNPVNPNPPIVALKSSVFSDGEQVVQLPSVRSISISIT